MLRTPLNPRTAIFPGNVLTVDGNGVWVNGPSATTTNTTEIRFKQPPNQVPPNLGLVPGTVVFKRLVLNGGQIDSGNDGLIIIQGEIDVATNSTIYNDNVNDRGYRIDSFLTGTGTIEFHGYNQTTFQPSNILNLNISGTSNTFSGKWNIVIGTLLGTGPNSLGTNDIVIGANAALETTYDITNTNANLFMSGRMYLHQNDTFKSVFVNGVPLAVGTYPAAQLAATYPTTFVTNWTPQLERRTFPPVLAVSLCWSSRRRRFRSSQLPLRCQSIQRRRHHSRPWPKAMCRFSITGGRMGYSSRTPGISQVLGPRI